MKKLLYTAFLVLTIFSANAQGSFSFGFHGGLPVGEIDEFTSFNAGLDLGYLFEVSDKLGVGIASGYTHFFNKTIETPFGTVDLEDFGFIPVASSFQFQPANQFFIGGDLGYGIATKGGTGGFLYTPKMGWDNGQTQVFGYYRGISNGGETVASVGVGIAFKN